MEIGKKIREQRLKKSLTLKELCNKVGVKENTMSEYENNKTVPSLNVFIKLCIELDTSPNYLLEDELKQ